MKTGVPAMVTTCPLTDIPDGSPFVSSWRMLKVVEFVCTGTKKTGNFGGALHRACGGGAREVRLGEDEDHRQLAARMGEREKGGIKLSQKRFYSLFLLLFVAPWEVCERYRRYFVPLSRSIRDSCFPLALWGGKGSWLEVARSPAENIQSSLRQDRKWILRLEIAGRRLVFHLIVFHACQEPLLTHFF